MSAVAIRWVTKSGVVREAISRQPHDWPTMLDDLSCFEAMGDKEITITLDTGEKWEWKRE